MIQKLFQFFFCSNCFSLSLFSLTRTRFDKYTHSYTKSKSEGEKQKLTRDDDATVYIVCVYRNERSRERKQRGS